MRHRLTSADARLFDRCRELARHAADLGNTAVGSVVAITGRVVAEAEEATPAGPEPFAHAEFIAVKLAMTRLGRKTVPEATLYTTAEPCFLCAFAIREVRIGRVIIGSPTPEIGGVSSRYPILAADDIARWGQPPTVLWVGSE